MKLFEITNGYVGETGEGYVRCYAWAEDKGSALVMASTMYSEYTNDDSQKELTVTELFDNSEGAFCTIVNSGGWEKPVNKFFEF